MSKRRGNADIRRVLLASRDAPWSHAEREGHRLLRAAKVRGWQTDYPMVDFGHLYCVDIALATVKLAVEIDARVHEDDAGVFEADRWRQNALVLSKVGACSASPGPCCATTQSSSCQRFGEH